MAKKVFKILIIDDMKDIVEMLSELLSYQGYLTLMATDGENGIRTNEIEDPDLIILDFKMPGMDGVEVLSKIRQTDKDVKVIMLSGYLDDELKLKTKDLNVGKYLSKPFIFDELFINVEQLLGKE